MGEAKELKPLSKKHKRVQDEYLKCWNQTKAYQAVYPNSEYESARTAAARLFANDNFSAHLNLRLNEAHMSADEALARQAEIGRASLGTFFKVVDEWMFNPLPEYEILDEKEVIEETDKGPVKRISYRVLHIVLDTEKVMDPQYSHLIKRFTNSRKTGLSIEMYSAQEAHRDALKVAGKLKDSDMTIHVNLKDD